MYFCNFSFWSVPPSVTPIELYCRVGENLGLSSCCGFQSSPSLGEQHTQPSESTFQREPTYSYPTLYPLQSPSFRFLLNLLSNMIDNLSNLNDKLISHLFFFNPIKLVIQRHFRDYTQLLQALGLKHTSLFFLGFLSFLQGFWSLLKIPGENVDVTDRKITYCFTLLSHCQMLVLSFALEVVILPTALLAAGFSKWF